MILLLKEYFTLSRGIFCWVKIWRPEPNRIELAILESARLRPALNFSIQFEFKFILLFLFFLKI